MISGIKIENDKNVPFVHIVPKKPEPVKVADAVPAKIAAPVTPVVKAAPVAPVKKIAAPEPVTPVVKAAPAAPVKPV